MKPVNQNQNETLTRRKWLGKLSVPAAAVLGVPLLGNEVFAARKEEQPLSSLGQKIFNVKDFGAKGDSTTLDTVAVQTAIDKCAEAKEGIVLIPEGTFIIGTIRLKDYVTLHLSAGGVLKGSPKREDYTAGEGIPTGNGNIVMLYASNARNVSITGTGTIDGNGEAFFTGKGDNTGPNSTGGGYFDRPHLLIFYKCNQLRLEDTFYTKSAYHCFRILQCEQVDINGVVIYNRVNRNNDGFHFNSCKYVHVTNCDVRCQDDACALFGSNQFVTISNSSFSTRWSIFRFGSGDPQNITISNCIIYDTYGCAIKISSGNVRLENFIFSNIVMRNVTGPIGIGFGGSTNAQDKVYMKNLIFSSITAQVVNKPQEHPDIKFSLNIFPGEHYSCITLNALKGHYIENVTFSDIHVQYQGGGSKELAQKQNIPQKSREYFTVWEEEPFGPPAYGFYARNVKNLRLNNIRLEYDEPDARSAMILENVQEAQMGNIALKGGMEAEATIQLKGCSDIIFTSPMLLSSSQAFLKLEESKNIVVDGGLIQKAKKKVVFGKNSSIKDILLRV
ncbi:glycoside hydrolase family 28 [Pseudopedobacter saltans DSM 12145]|uniref:Glycoside hydrolase family 28 n=1 Tax=Pseudopedobacter saltans (strain ATCC 51119 / DSM 12145 / JCM 21818 / CCUG 39354 / LMG 10337 / NBRC 100064 / NCIMB 13643) TaxID=762903 RepID=F0S4Y5_PSESL|nr:glycosyl hydrolase family 28 protein [Pseudopedobacter saltans]ADY54159.1 glycoside hydrolase family 28 [Pseudopedobacter saltans DSM 12145]